MQAVVILDDGRLDLVETVRAVAIADDGEHTLAAGLFGGEEVAHAARRVHGCHGPILSSATARPARAPPATYRTAPLAVIAGATHPDPPFLPGERVQGLGSGALGGADVGLERPQTLAQSPLGVPALSPGLRDERKQGVAELGL